MNNIFLDFVLTAIPLAIVAWFCVYISRPFFTQKWAKIASQTAAVFLLMVSYIISKGISEDKSSNDAEVSVLLTFVASFFVMKFIAMYLIACYAKSVNKSPYWSFVGALNFILAFILLIGLWKSVKQSKLTHEEMIGGLRRMVDDPDTSEEKRDWATDRLRTFERP